MTENYILNRAATPPVLLYDKTFNLGRPIGATPTAEIYHRFTSNDEGSRWGYDWRVPYGRKNYGISIQGDTNTGQFFIKLPDGELDNLGRVTGNTSAGIITRINFALITRPVPTVRIALADGQAYELVGDQAVYPDLGNNIMQIVRVYHDAYDASLVKGVVRVTISMLAL